MEQVAPERKLTVARGNNSDRCPLCGIRRENAGFIQATCGRGYLQPGCFVEQTTVVKVGEPA